MFITYQNSPMVSRVLLECRLHVNDVELCVNKRCKVTTRLTRGLNGDETRLFKGLIFWTDLIQYYNRSFHKMAECVNSVLKKKN